MKTYLALTKMTADERNVELKSSFNRAVVLTNEKKDLQKNVAKQLVAMIASGDCKNGEIRKHAMRITGEDIRESLQDVYGLVNVFQGVIDKTVEITEEQYDVMDQAKLALLSPFMADDAKPELKQNLAAAVEAAKNGTAKQIRELKPKTESKAQKELDELKAKGTPIAFGFIATDISPKDAMVKSKQFKARLMEDFTRAIESEDEATLLEMMSLFGKAYLSACASLGENPMECLTAFIAKNAEPAAASVVETPAALECEAVAA